MTHTDPHPSGEATGPISGQPPPASDETKAALLGASKEDATGQSAPGQDGGVKDEGKKVKSEKEREDPNT
jgi:valyl-tRNA synthetase